MRSLRASDLARQFYEYGLRVSVPKSPKSIQTFRERVDSICWHHQGSAILDTVGAPPSPKDGLDIASWIRRNNEYKKRSNRELQSGTGRESLISKFSAYKSPERIPDLILETYNIDPREGGILAHELLSYNPRIANPVEWNSTSDEPTECIVIPGTEIAISFRVDLEDFYGGLYEFKLTKDRHKAQRLQEAIIQIYIYDFVMRIKYKIKYFQDFLVDIALIDESRVLHYDLTASIKSLDDGKRFFRSEVKQKLSELFKASCEDQIEAINQVLNVEYDAVRQQLPEDVENIKRRHR